MAPDRWVVNASPLILLGKVERIQLFGALAGDIALPRAVIREVGAKPGGERTVQTLTILESAIVVDDEVPPANILSWDLGPGEAQVISYADMTVSSAPAMPKSIWSSKKRALRGASAHGGPDVLYRCSRVGQLHPEG